MTTLRHAVTLGLALVLALVGGLVIGRSFEFRPHPGEAPVQAAPDARDPMPPRATPPTPPMPPDHTGTAVAPALPPVPPPAPIRDPATDEREERALRGALAAAADDPARRDARRALAKFLHNCGRYVAAADEWRVLRKETDTLADHRGEADALLAFAEEVLTSGAPGGGIRAAYEDAKLALLRLKAAGEDTATTARGLARCAEAQGDAEAHVSLLADASTRWPEDGAVRRAYAFALLNADRSADAAPLFRRLSDEAQTDVVLARALSYCLRMQGDIVAAGDAAERAVRAAPRDRGGWDSLWEAFARSGRFGELAARVATLAEALPDNASAAHYAGFAYANAGRNDEALRWLAEAWRRAPDNLPARLEAARILRDVKKDTAAAAAIYREVLARSPGHAGAIAGLSFVAQTLGAERKHAEALPFFEEVARALPENGSVQADMALALRWLGRYDEALAAYRRAVDVAPSDAQIRNDMGLLLLVMHRDEDAAATFRAGHDVDPLHNDGPENLGFMARERGDLAEARRWFGAALEAAERRGNDDLRARHRRNTDDVTFPLRPLFE